jgi:Zn-dependent protease with chaperone function
MRKIDITLTSEFKARTISAIISLVIFALTYLLILAIAVMLTALCVYGGIMLIISMPRLVTLLLGAGLASFGILILVFLLKFMFKSHIVDRSHLVEIKRDDEPKLFAMIDEIVKEVGTSFPKKVYLSADVNAAVFYDSSFWSMFLPIQKNLQIGIGLVNTVTRDELKAILSHEFGHFSQRTMKVGSFVYNVNLIIFNMLYDNESYEQMIQKWAGLSNYIAIFAILAVKLNEGIQWILRKMYGVVNKSYMGLSREMEFQADEIAARICGYEPLKNSLLRMSLGDQAYNEVLTYNEANIEANLKSENIYKEQKFVMKYLARESDIPIVDNLPRIENQKAYKFRKSSLVVTNQWASHPSDEDRIARLKKLNIKVEHEEEKPAGSVFQSIERTQKYLTSKLFLKVPYKEKPENNPFEKFVEEYLIKRAEKSFPEIYNGYYDQKDPVEFNLTEAEINSEDKTTDELFSDEKIELVQLVLTLREEISTLEKIAAKEIKAKTFDYEGKRFKGEESFQLKEDLAQKLKEAEEKIKQNDILIFGYFRKKELAKEGEALLRSYYENFFGLVARMQDYYNAFFRLSVSLQFIRVKNTPEAIREKFLEMMPVEKVFKKQIESILNNALLVNEIPKEMKENFELYLSKQWDYFKNDIYYEENLRIMAKAMDDFSTFIPGFSAYYKRKMLFYQAQLLNTVSKETIVN